MKKRKKIAKKKVVLKKRKVTKKNSPPRSLPKVDYEGHLIDDNMPRRNATIGKQAFVGMITNAIEVYKKETFGMLIGQKHKHHYFVADSIAIQSAERSYEWVNIKAHRINRINLALSHLSNNQLIGDFHSHPGGPDKLSNVDVEDLLKKVPTLTVLVSIKKTKACQKWKADGKAISGSIGSEFLVKILAYEVDHVNRVVHPIKVVCPYLRKINKLKLYESPLC